MPRQYNTTALEQAVDNLPKNVKVLEPCENNLTYSQKVHLLIIYNIICPADERKFEKRTEEWLHIIKTNRRGLPHEATKDLDGIDLYVFQRAIMAIRPLPQRFVDGSAIAHGTSYARGGPGKGRSGWLARNVVVFGLCAI
jgi:hypothetical protein